LSFVLSCRIVMIKEVVDQILISDYILIKFHLNNF
jgi:hypothetical protein